MSKTRITPAQALYLRLGVNVIALAQSFRRDTSIAGNAPQNPRHRSRRQHEALTRAGGTRRKYTKTEHTTTVWGAIEGQRKFLRSRLG